MRADAAVAVVERVERFKFRVDHRKLNKAVRLVAVKKFFPTYLLLHSASLA